MCIIFLNEATVASRLLPDSCHGTTMTSLRTAACLLAFLPLASAFHLTGETSQDAEMSLTQSERLNVHSFLQNACSVF